MLKMAEYAKSNFAEVQEEEIPKVINYSIPKQQGYIQCSVSVVKVKLSYYDLNCNFAFTL